VRLRLEFISSAAADLIDGASGSLFAQVVGGETLTPGKLRMKEQSLKRWGLLQKAKPACASLVLLSQILRFSRTTFSSCLRMDTLSCSGSTFFVFDLQGEVPWARETEIQSCLGSRWQPLRCLGRLLLASISNSAARIWPSGSSLKWKIFGWNPVRQEPPQFEK
jgi:hypothetical protein